jgi:hypothetical protein
MMGKKGNGQRREKPNSKRNGLLVYVVLLAVAFSFRVAVARLLANDTPDDGRVYAQIATNILEHHVYSNATEPPFDPTLIRLPGYPLFLAAIYSIFGHGDNTAVRVVQALIDTVSCALIALIAFLWEPDVQRKRRSSIAALALAAVCPFTTIYVATILTETIAVFLAVALCLLATLALLATTQRKAVWLWGAAGLLAGLAVMFRPDSALFALAIGITLVVNTLFRSHDLKLSRKRDDVLYRIGRTSFLGALFSLAFCLALVPWTIRNFRVFHLFQPLAPAHAEMPGEFVPRGYLTWVRSWIDDSRYVGPALWAMDTSVIKLDDFPDSAFDSEEEQKRVGTLLERYNHPGATGLFVEPGSQNSTPPADQENQKPSEPANPQNESTPTKQSSSAGESSPAPEASPSPETDENDNTAGDDESDESDESEESDQGAETSAADQEVQMTPEIDAGFARIAQERIARHPFRYYVWLPLKRARTLWLDTHSQYYPFEGELLPIEDLDYDIHQQYWLPLFAVLTFIYTALGIVGAWFLGERADFVSRQWVLLAALMIFLRLGFFATMENPEPRYVVELFSFLTILGGIGLLRLGTLLKHLTRT